MRSGFLITPVAWRDTCQLIFNLQQSRHMRCWRRVKRFFIRENKERVLLIHLSVNVARAGEGRSSVFYLKLMQSFFFSFWNLRSSLQHEQRMTRGKG